MKVFQKGFNYSQDGRGNRLVWHLQGCNMRCPWCSNPEGMSPDGTLMTDANWLRASCCPMGAVSEGRLDRSHCNVCKDRPCASRRQRGIRLSCRDYTVEEMLEESAASKPMFFDGGGVTLTGGEVTMQFDEVKRLLALLGEQGIHRAIETNGSHPRSEELIPLVDQWIMDVKHYDDAAHRRWVGVSNAQTIRTLCAAALAHDDVLIRVPLIPGFNDAEKDADGFASLFRRMAPNVKYEFLAYHEYGKAKWAQCGLEYAMGTARLPEGRRAYFEARLREAGLCCVRT